MPTDEIAGEATVPLEQGELDARVRFLAAEAAAVIDSRISAGEDTGTVVADVIGGLFGDDATAGRIAGQVCAILRAA